MQQNVLIIWYALTQLVTFDQHRLVLMNIKSGKILSINPGIDLLQSTNYGVQKIIFYVLNTNGIFCQNLIWDVKSLQGLLAYVAV